MDGGHDSGLPVLTKSDLERTLMLRLQIPHWERFDFGWENWKEEGKKSRIEAWEWKETDECLRSVLLMNSSTNVATATADTTTCKRRCVRRSRWKRRVLFSLGFLRGRENQSRKDRPWRDHVRNRCSCDRGTCGRSNLLQKWRPGLGRQPVLLAWLGSTWKTFQFHCMHMQPLVKPNINFWFFFILEFKCWSHFWYYFGEHKDFYPTFLWTKRD